VVNFDDDGRARKVALFVVVAHVIRRLEAVEDRAVSGLGNWSRFDVAGVAPAWWSSKIARSGCTNRDEEQRKRFGEACACTDKKK